MVYGNRFIKMAQKRNFVYQRPVYIAIALHQKSHIWECVYFIATAAETYNDNFDLTNFLLIILV